MNKREARKYACRLASVLIDQALAAGGWNFTQDLEQILDDEDMANVSDQLDLIAQKLFERGQK